MCDAAHAPSLTLTLTLFLSLSLKRDIVMHAAALVGVRADRLRGQHTAIRI